MRCSEVGQRLVAWRDGELGRSERRQVEEHVGRCAACAEIDRRLRASRPRPPPLVPPPEILVRLERAIDPDLLLALADQPAPRARSWLRAASRHLGWSQPSGPRIPISLPAAVAYLVLLAGTFGWGLSNWWSLRSMAPSLQPPIVGPAIPADQFRPAAYAPGAPDPGSPGAPIGR